MKIAIDGRYIQDHFPGIARYTFNLIENLAELVEDELAVLYDPSPANSRYDVFRLEKTGNVRIHEVPCRAFSPAEQFLIPAFLARQRFDLLHSPHYAKPYLRTPKSVVTIHDVIMKIHPESTPSKKSHLLFDLAVRLSLRSVTRVITVSEFSKASLVKYFGARPENIRVIYEGVDPRFRPLDKAELAPLRERLWLPESFVLYVGINKPHKNLPRLIEAFARVRQEVDVDLVIAGKEDARYPQARVMADKLGLSEHVRFLGDVAEVNLPGLYNLADLFVFPSLCEGFGLPVLEAMACGIPVVCSGTSSLPEVVGDSALLVDPYSATDIAEGIVRAGTDSVLYERLRAKGLQRAARFSWRETARQTLAVYREALS